MTVPQKQNLEHLIISKQNNDFNLPHYGQPKLFLMRGLVDYRTVWTTGIMLYCPVCVLLGRGGIFRVFWTLFRLSNVGQGYNEY